MDDIIFLGCTTFSSNDKKMYKISYAVKINDRSGNDYLGYECGMHLTSEDFYRRLSKLKPMDHFKGIVIRGGKPDYALRLIRLE